MRHGALRYLIFFFFSSRRRHTSLTCDWSSDVCSSDLGTSLPILQISRLEALSDRGTKALRGVDLVVREGEIVGVAGVGGNGQSELAQCILGLRRVTEGTITVGAADIARYDPE